MAIGIELGRILVTLGGLFVFGILYAWLIYWMRVHNYLDPYTASMVAFGVLITIAVNKYIHHPDPYIDFLLELASFIASGLPMIAGSMLTHLWAVARDEQKDVLMLEKLREHGNAET